MSASTLRERQPLVLLTLSAMGLLAAALPAAVRRWGSSARWSPDAETELIPAVFTVPPDRSPSTQKDAAGLTHEVRPMAVRAGATAPAASARAPAPLASAEDSAAVERSALSLQTGPWPADRVRQVYLDFFAARGHTFVQGCPVVPFQDPSLLFINSGMAQFKPIFQGNVDPTSPLASLVRAANSQPCVRAGGKHNDLEDVGFDTYHHTLFEMLGNWSFGDYFKEDAVAWAWELLTEVYGLPADRFYATYFEGDETQGLKPDLETRDLWTKFLPADRVLPGNAKDNFWEMGDTGPCGPCSELHYDRIGGRDAASLVNMDDPDVLEVWNLVFMQFNREPSGELRTLPAQHVDTGMGFERLVSVLQDVRSNYDTDVFAALFTAIQRVTGARPYAGRLGAEDPDNVDTAYRVIADHVRTLSFAIADGAVPSNEGRGYVLRRILRRAVRYGRQILDAKEGFFTELVPTVVEQLGPVFPALVEQQERIESLVREEESSFSAMLGRGIKEFNARAQAIETSGASEISGADAFFLYDSMGFPLDLTQLMASEKGLGVDTAGFEAAMAEQKARSAAAQKGGAASALTLGPEQTAWLAEQGVPFTDDAAKFIWEDKPATLRAVFDGTAFVDSVDGPGTRVGLVLDATTFFSEAGGQTADVGKLAHLGGDFHVQDVQKFGGYVLHIGELRDGVLRVGEGLTGSVDYDRREKVAANHTMTHMLNAGLRAELGPGIDQKGSYLDDARLRFDFNFGKALTADQLERVETYVQASIQDKLPIYTAVVPLERAQGLPGLRAVFGERYPDPVRVVAVGHATVEKLLEAAEDGQELDPSVELCGGTHLRTNNTAEAGAFAVVQEEAVAKGIRRIVALTGAAAEAAIAEGAALEAQVAAWSCPEAAELPELEACRAEVGTLREAVDASTASSHLKTRLRDRLAANDKQVAAKVKQRKQQAVDGAADAVLAEAADAAQRSAQFLVVDVPGGLDGKALQALVKKVQKAVPGLAVLALSGDADADKVSVLAAVPEALQAALPAQAWLKAALDGTGGRGGGKAASAQGSAPAGAASAARAAAEAHAKAAVDAA